jgi:hypothetical protein
LPVRGDLPKRVHQRSVVEVVAAQAGDVDEVPPAGVGRSALQCLDDLLCGESGYGDAERESKYLRRVQKLRSKAAAPRTAAPTARGSSRARLVEEL